MATVNENLRDALRQVAAGEGNRLAVSPVLDDLIADGLAVKMGGDVELTVNGKTVLTELELGDPTPGALTEVELPAWQSNRYYLVEADGKANSSGFDQKPAALRNAKYSGKGVFDTRTSDWIAAPNVARREVELGVEIESLKAKLAATEGTLADIRKIHRTSPKLREAMGESS